MRKEQAQQTVKNGLLRRGNSWYICVKVNGRNIRKSFGADKTAALLALAEVKRERGRAKVSDDWSGLEALLAPKSQKTFAEAAADYMAERVALKESTIRTYSEHLKNYLLPQFGEMQIHAITEAHVARFQALLSQRLSPRRANSTVNLLRSVLRVCVRRKLIEENPSDGVVRLQEPRASVDPLTEEDLRKVLGFIAKRYQVIFTCLAWTGARPCELKALRWNDIDFNRNEIRINKARVKNSEGLTKTSSSERTMTFPRFNGQ